MSSDFLRTLVVLRWWTVLGQSLIVILALYALGLDLHAVPLWSGIAVLALFNIAVWWMLPAEPAPPAPPAQAALHLGVDIAQLAWMIAFSGGAMNPFVSLFLVPVALATLALPVTWVWSIAAASSVGYALAVSLGPPLPHVHGFFGSTFDLHLWGMAVTFLLSALIFILVLTRLARLRERREREMAALRERAARSEGILGLATQAAATAHGLNTPLATLTLLLDDLVGDHRLAPELVDDVERARGVVRVCRDRVRRLVDEARSSAAGVDDDDRPRVPLAGYLRELVEGWSLLRPSVQVDERIDLPASSIRPDHAVTLLVQALLDNAADASLGNGRNEVVLRVHVDEDSLCIEIEDHGGAGLDRRLASGRLFASSKPEGMGLGLALSHATVDALGGELRLCPSSDGVVTRVRLPWVGLGGEPGPGGAAPRPAAGQPDTAATGDDA